MNKLNTNWEPVVFKFQLENLSEDEITKAVYLGLYHDATVSDPAKIKTYAEKVFAKINGTSQKIDTEGFGKIVGVAKPSYLDLLASLRYLVLTDKIPFVCFKEEEANLDYPDTKEELLKDSKAWYESATKNPYT
jgi:hypothetical protein